ncbi:MAG TPA: hypothetical protein VLE53_00015 [Gemmatimonadaceae bacterium]|nr:hypothetical protein [Gemmatimonadaceae bacterium]
MTLARLVADDDPHGASDAIRYGLSLSRVARTLPNTPGVLIVPGGAETPLAMDVLEDRRWGSWAEQCRRSKALMLVAAPSDGVLLTPLLDQIDGVIVVGGSAVPPTRAPFLGRVRPVRRTPRRARLVPDRPARRRRRLVGQLLLLGALVGSGAVVLWRFRSPASQVDRSTGGAVGAGQALASAPVLVDPAPVPIDTVGLAPWSVELSSVNSAAGALLRVRQAVDSVPVPTYSPTLLGATSAPWYRLVAGAYSQMTSADSLLAALRDRGVVEPGAGRVVRTPYTWLVEDSVPPDLVQDRLFVWRQQGLPAYALFDTAGFVRIYVGAFESEAEARLLAPVLDSLNLHATLSARVGSIR